MKEQLENPKKCWIFSNFLEFSWIFLVFKRFFINFFLYSEIQLRANHHKNLHEMLRRTYIMRPRGTTGENWFYTKNLSKMGFYVG